MSNLRHPEPETLIRTYGVTFCTPEVAPPRSDDWHQLAISTGSPLRLVSESTTWLIPNGTGLWIPAGIGCKFLNRSATSVRMLYLPSSSDRETPFSSGKCEAIGLSPFFRALIEKIVLIGALVAKSPQHRRLAELVWDEVEEAERVPLGLVIPKSEATRRLLEELERKCFRLDTLESAVASSGFGRRTLERRFLEETNLTIGAWLRKRRVLFALERLLAGDQVSDIAFDLGYNGASAFIAMFKKEFGVSPSRYASATSRKGDGPD